MSTRWKVKPYQTTGGVQTGLEGIDIPEDFDLPSCGIEDVDNWIEGIIAWRPRAKMMAMLWYLLAFQLWGDEEYFLTASQIAEDLSVSCDT